MDQLSPLVADEEEDVEDSEAHGLDHEEIGSPDTAKLVGQEGSPALAVPTTLEIEILSREAVT